jgi:outer membrane murein-binding lipoprotein Lpp
MFAKEAVELSRLVGGVALSGSHSGKDSSTLSSQASTLNSSVRLDS